MQPLRGVPGRPAHARAKSGLCFASREKRSVPQSLRAGGRAMISRIQHPQLRATIQEMTTSHYPEVQLSRIRDCVKRMESPLIRAQKKLGDFQ